jgi:very-short-patch-repair endonuclease
MGRSKALKRSVFCLPYDRELVDRAKEMRRNPTAAERKLWEGCLAKFPYRVLRQRPMVYDRPEVIDYFIVDFYCAALQLVIEVDGEVHESEQAQGYDGERSNILAGYGLQVLRVTNAEVMGDFDRVCAQVLAFVGDPPSPLKKGEPE